MAYVQSVSAATSALINVLTTPAITTTTGNFLVMGTSVLNNANNPVPSDSNVNVWTAHSSNPLVITGQNFKGYCWSAKNITGGSGHTFTVTSSLTSNSSIVVSEFSGRALDFPVAAQAGSVEAAATVSHTTGSVTTPFAGCDLYAFNFTSSNVSEAFNTGQVWTIAPNAQNASGNLYQPSFGQIFSNAYQGIFNNTWHTSDTVQGGGFTYAIKQPSATFIQQLSGSSAVSTNSINLPAASQVNITTGNLILYVAKYTASSIQTVTVTDSLNNTWQQITSFFDPTSSTGLAFGFAKNIVGGPDNITVTLGTSQTFVGFLLQEWSGLSQTNPFTTGEYVIAKNISPGNGADGVASAFTVSISRRPAVLFGLCIDLTNTAGQVLTAGTNFNPFPGIWVFGGSQTSSLPEYKRI